MIPLRDEIFIRENGEQVAFSEYGDTNGEPVMFCHGWPSSRLMAQFTHDAARELGVRIISPDRPGIADSSFVVQRKLLDWAPLVSELADFLKLEKFRALGISGGAPYAYALAWAMPERVRVIAVVSGAPNIAELSDRSGLLALYRWLMFADQRFPAPLCRLGFRLARPLLSLRPPRRSRSWLLKFLQPFDADSLVARRFRSKLFRCGGARDGEENPELPFARHRNGWSLFGAHSSYSRNPGRLDRGLMRIAARSSRVRQLPDRGIPR